MSNRISGYPRATGQFGARNHVLVLPSVVCATRVARDVASATDVVSVTHQLGCSQLGDDAARTSHAFEALATSPNVGAVVVISLGCETLQGRDLATRIDAAGQRVVFVGIQDVGGSDQAESVGCEAARNLAAELAGTPRVIGDASRITIGIESPRASQRTHDFVQRVLNAGASVVIDARTAEGLPESTSAGRYSAFEHFERGPGLTLLEGTGDGPQQHVALVVAGAHIIVSFTAADEAPSGFPVCPVIAVADDSALHQAIAADFDLPPSASSDDIWRQVLRIQNGDPTRAERWGSASFALERVAMTL